MILKIRNNELKIRNNNAEDKKLWCWKYEIMMMKIINHDAKDRK